MIRWISAFIGFSFFRFPGAIVGFIIGQLLENVFYKSNFSSQNRFRHSDEKLMQVKLLTLAAIVIKADGKVDSKELEYVRRFFISHYGKNQSDEIFKIFNSKVKNQTQSLDEITDSFVINFRYETRLQLIHFLFGIAEADGNISKLELIKINQIASSLEISSIDFESIHAMFVKEENSAYKILEVDSKSSIEEIKKAYRIMVKKYHPDKLQTKDPYLLKGAEEKFRQVQVAYERLKNKHKF
ncbi:MAG: TerB family tellurite resistance protein [Flavobacteriaceae bacterium]|nr:TerB family tellurite resistance protein [Flavobacteriaceae bacterium]